LTNDGLDLLASSDRIEGPNSPLAYVRIKAHCFNPTITTWYLLGVAELPRLHLSVELLDDVLLADE
jgi:hypothetical protein